MIRTFWTLQSRVEDLLKRHNLTLAQFDSLAMLLLLEHLNLNQQELANHLAVTKGNMVGLVNRLSRRGFVQRIPSKGRRENVIRLTNSGRHLVEAALLDHRRLVTAMMSSLTGKENLKLRALLRRLEGESTRPLFRPEFPPSAQCS